MPARSRHCNGVLLLTYHWNFRFQLVIIREGSSNHSPEPGDLPVLNYPLIGLRGTDQGMDPIFPDDPYPKKLIKR